MISMTDGKLVDYIRIQLARKVNMEDIKQKLRDAGWSDNDIESATEYVVRSMPSISPEKAANLAETGVKVVSAIKIKIIVWAVLVFAIVAYLVMNSIIPWFYGAAVMAIVVVLNVLIIRRIKHIAPLKYIAKNTATSAELRSEENVINYLSGVAKKDSQRNRESAPAKLPAENAVIITNQRLFFVTVTGSSADLENETQKIASDSLARRSIVLKSNFCLELGDIRKINFVEFSRCMTIIMRNGKQLSYTFTNTKGFDKAKTLFSEYV